MLTRQETSADRRRLIQLQHPEAIAFNDVRELVQQTVGTSSLPRRTLVAISNPLTTLTNTGRCSASSIAAKARLLSRRLSECQNRKAAVSRIRREPGPPCVFTPGRVSPADGHGPRSEIDVLTLDVITSKLVS